MVVVLSPSVYGLCLLVVGATAVFFLFHQNGEFLANSWSSEDVITDSTPDHLIKQLLAIDMSRFAHFRGWQELHNY